MKIMKRPEKPQDEGLTYGKDDSSTRERLREIILYLAELSENDPKFGATKLNKLLFYSDFISFREYGHSITGAQYMRLPNGPVPAHFVPYIRDEMIASGDIEIQITKHYTKPQQRLVAKRKANLDLFSGRDIDLINEIVDELKDYNATDISNLSHGRAWSVAEDKELLPYEAILLSDAKLTSSDIQWANELIQEHGWHNV